MCSQNTIQSGLSKARQVKYNKPKVMKTLSNGDFNRSFVLGAMPGCVAMSVLRDNYMVHIRWSQQWPTACTHTLFLIQRHPCWCLHDPKRSWDLCSAVNLTIALATTLHTTQTHNCVTAASKRLPIWHNQNALSPPPAGKLSDLNFSQDTL